MGGRERGKFAPSSGRAGKRFLKRCAVRTPKGVLKLQRVSVVSHALQTGKNCLFKISSG